MKTNNEVVQIMIKKTGVENQNQLAYYLSKKYGANITSSQLLQFRKSNPETVTHYLLREALE